MENKTCVSCKQTKSLENFYETKKGYDYYCKRCRTGMALKSHRKPKKGKNCSVEGCDINHYAKGLCRPHYARLVRNGTTDLLIGRSTVYSNGSTYHEYRDYYLKSAYDITNDEYEVMADNGCEVCGASKHGRTQKLHIDHDHNHCNKSRGCKICMRGIVCNKCNTAIDKYEEGILREDYPNYQNVLVYVAKYSKVINDRIYENEQSERQ